MINKLFSEQRHAPTAWERSAAVATWLSVNITLLAVVLGLLEFILLRKRRPYIAFHGARAAVAQAIIMFFCIALYISAIRLDGIRDSLPYLTKSVVPNIIHSPGLLSYYWSIISPLSRIMLSIILGITPAILLVSIIGAYSALIGRRQPYTSPPVAAQ